MRRHADQHVLQVGEGVDADSLAALDQRIDDRRRRAAAHAAGEEPVPTADRYRPDRTLARVVVDRHAAVLDEAHESRPLPLDVAARVPPFARHASILDVASPTYPPPDPPSIPKLFGRIVDNDGDLEPYPGRMVPDHNY